MANVYTEDAKRQISKPDSGPWTGSRVFTQVPVGTADAVALPVYGDAFPLTTDARETAMKAVFFDDRTLANDGRKIRVIVNYSERSFLPPGPNQADVQSFDDTTSFDLTPKKLSVSSTSVQLDNGQSAAVFVGSGDPIRIPRYKRIPTATWTIPKIYNSWNPLLRVLSLNIGKVSSSDFGNLPGDIWMFTGSEAGEFLNTDGVVQIRADHSFEMKLHPGANGTTLGWNAIYNQANEEWLNVSPDMYESTNFLGIW